MRTVLPWALVMPRLANDQSLDSAGRAPKEILRSRITCLRAAGAYLALSISTTRRRHLTSAGPQRGRGEAYSPRICRGVTEPRMGTSREPTFGITYVGRGFGPTPRVLRRSEGVEFFHTAARIAHHIATNLSELAFPTVTTPIHRPSAARR